MRDSLRDCLYVIPCNYGIESIALIEWMRQQNYTNVHCLYVDTGWSAPEWPERVKEAEAWVRSIGFQATTLYPKRNFEELMIEQKKFPTQKFQWCASFLKGLPILEYLDFELDPEMQATVVLALRRSAARSLINLQEFIESSEHYNGRRMWHPLYMHGTGDVDKLWVASGLDKSIELRGLNPVIARRSLECFVCVNGSFAELLAHKERPIMGERLSALESAIGLPFPSGENTSEGLEAFLRGCGLPFGCGL